MPRVSKKQPVIELKVFNSGWVNTHKGIVLSGGGWEKLRVPAMFAMIRHPSKGIILYDTGYHTRFFEVTSRFPYNILKIFTPAEISEDQNAVRQLEKAGVSPDDVKIIIIGHGHVDHIPGLIDFPKAKVIVDRREWAFMQGSAFNLFRKGYLKPFCEGIHNEIELVNFTTQGKRYSSFDAAVDLWGDKSMILVPLEGHTVGQMGLIVNLSDGRRFFFVGDAAWISENYLKLKPPAFPVRTILSSYREFRRSLHLLNDFHREFPDVIIVPCHCPAVWEKLQSISIAAER